MATDSKSVIIIGAGIAGLSTGVYAQKNGYKSRIYEMHSLPGGLMTAWKRKGYTIDGCIHWLCGSNPNSSYYSMWEEVGIAPATKFFDPEVFTRVESPDGRAVNFYTDPDRLEKHLLELFPEDEKPIRQFIKDIRLFTGFEPPSLDGGLKGFLKLLGDTPRMVAGFLRMRALDQMTAGQWAAAFKDPFLRKTMAELWMENLSAMLLPATLGMLAAKNAGYPLGGSLPMARAVEKHYCSLGGEIYYDTRVEKILVEPLPDGSGSRAVGVRLADGREERADYVISAADLHATIFKMLDGKFASPEQREMFEKGEIFPPLLYIGLGVDREFPDLHGITCSVVMYLDEPLTAGGLEYDRLEFTVYTFDPSLAPPGKSVMTVAMPGSYSYWKDLAVDPERYESEKKQAALQVIDRLDRRFPGLAGQVEMVDVATPLTFERFTGNWQGSFEGWLPVPGKIMTPLKKTLPGLHNFFLAGQWVQTGGGIPSGPISAREVVAMMCKQDGHKFKK